MNKNSLQQLIALVQYDQASLLIEKELEKVQEELEKAQKEEFICRESLEKLDEYTKSIHKEVQKKELEMKRLDQEEKEKRKRLETAADRRQFDSLQKEVDILKKEQHDLEEDLLMTWKKYETAQVEHKNKHLFCQEKLTSLDTAIQGIMQKITELEKANIERQAGRAEKLRGIPEDLLEKYSAMYQRVSNPVVPVEKNSCSACFYPLTQQALHDAREGKLLQCKDCFRFLYDPQAHESQSSA
jgi:predicted  nucleic acid-binding Zn-ribbon protein